MIKYFLCIFIMLLSTSCISNKQRIVSLITNLNAMFLLKDFDNFNNINSKNNNGNSLLHEVVFADKKELPKKNKIKLIKVLIDKGANVNSQNSKGESPLHIIATQENKVEIAKILLQHNADLEILNNKGETALTYCGYNLFFYYNDKLVELFIKHGANVDSYNSYGSTLLHVLCGYYSGGYGTEDFVKNLILYGADINSREKFSGNTPLMNAVQRNAYDQPQIILTLLKMGADIEIKNKKGNSVFHFIQHVSSIEPLIKSGANINLQNNEGNTILHFLCNCNDKKNKRPRYFNPNFQIDRTSLIMSLIKKGASLDIVNKEGKTPGDLLKKPCNRELIKTMGIKTTYMLNNRNIYF